MAPSVIVSLLPAEIDPSKPGFSHEASRRWKDAGWLKSAPKRVSLLVIHSPALALVNEKQHKAILSVRVPMRFIGLPFNMRSLLTSIRAEMPDGKNKTGDPEVARGEESLRATLDRPAELLDAVEAGLD
ncbi:MAG: hypothetical protein ACKOKC_18115, partial [Chthoniobacterales bacterium]